MLSPVYLAVPGNWRKSSYSSPDGDCIEAGSVAGRIHVRDTKQRGGPVLSFAADQWRALADQVKDA